MQAAEKEEFKNYLEKKTGVIDAMTKVLVGLYDETEKPTNALDWIGKHLSANIGSSQSQELDSLKKEVEELKKWLEQPTETEEEGVDKQSIVFGLNSFTSGMTLLLWAVDNEDVVTQKKNRDGYYIIAKLSKFN